MGLVDQIQEVTEVEVQEPASESAGQETVDETSPPITEPEKDVQSDAQDDTPSPGVTEDSPAEAGQESTEAEKGQEAAGQWYDEFGYKSPEEAIKGLREIRAMNTRVSQEKAEIEKKAKGYEDTLAQMQAYFSGEEQTRDTEENPELMDLDEKILKTPTMKNVVTFLNQVAEDRRKEKITNDIATFKSAHKDYGEYEEAMAEILTVYGKEGARWLFAGPGGTEGALKQLYDQARIKKFSADAEAKAKIAAAEKDKVEAANKGAVNLLGEHVDSDILNTNGGIAVKQEEETPFDGTLSYFTN